MNPAHRGMHSPTPDTPVVIVGAGLSGMAAAVELASRAVPVLVLEQRQKAGGRAYSFTDATTGDVIDNGQHVLIAGYLHTMEFLERIGTKHLVTVQPRPVLHFHHPERGFCSFALPALPNPLHLLSGILSSNLFALPDKLRLLWGGLRLRWHDTSSAGKTIGEWLDDARQSTELKRSFWEPLAIAIMNEHVAKASAFVFLNSLRQAFLADRNNSALVIPRVGLSELYVNEAAAFINARGGNISFGADVTGVIEEDGRAAGVELRGGEVIPGAAVILSVPHYRLPALLPDRLTAEYAEAASRESTPIVSIHLWFADEFMPQEFLGLVDRRVQWVFNKRRINHEQGKEGHLSCVISGADDFVDLTNEALVAIALEDLRGVFGAAVGFPSHSVVVREKRATFSCTPDAFRPGHETSVGNLFIAGDWTDTGLPATIEGAIISGNRCAELAVRSLKG